MGLSLCEAFSQPPRAIIKTKQIGILLAQMPFFVVLRRLRKRAFYASLYQKKSPGNPGDLLRFVIRLGFEPKTHSLEGCCSIQLSYRTVHAGEKLLSTAVCKDSPFWANGKLFFSKGKRDFGTVLE